MTEQKAKINIEVSREKFEGEFETKGVTNTELCKKINAFFKAACSDFVGSELVIAPTTSNSSDNYITQQLSIGQDCNAYNRNRPPYLVLYFRDNKVQDASKIKVLQLFNAVNNASGLNYLTGIARSQNSYRRYTLTDPAKKFLSKFVVKQHENENIDWENENSEMKFVHEIVNQEINMPQPTITVKIVGLEIGRILPYLFEPGDGSDVEYQLRVVKSVNAGPTVDIYGRIIQSAPREYVIAIEQYKRDKVAKLTEKFGIVPVTSTGINMVTAD